MIEVNSAAVVTVPGEGCKHEFNVSDILTPATALTRYKTIKLDMCYFGDTINLLAKAVKERQSFPLTCFLIPNCIVMGEVTASVLQCAYRPIK